MGQQEETTSIDQGSEVQSLERKDPELERILLEALRKMTPAQKFQKVSDMMVAMHILAMSDVKRRYPDADERECQLRVASRRVPADMMLKAFGWDVNEKGY